MMTTPVSQGRTLFKQLLIIPLLIGFIYAFSSKVYAQKTTQQQVHKIKVYKGKLPPPPPPKTVTIHKEKNTGHGSISIGKDTYYYKTANGVKTYYDSHGKLINRKHIESKLPPLPPKKNSKPKSVKVHKEGGRIKIDGVTYFYKVKNNVRVYYDNFGNKIDAKKIKKLLPPPPPPPRTTKKPVQVKINKTKKSININGSTYFYKVKNNIKTYYDKYGKQIDAKEMKKILPPPPPPPKQKH